MQLFLGDPDSGKLHLETHRLALAIAKKTLDENRFTATQKTVSRDKPTFQVGDHVYFKNKQPGKWDLKWRPGYWIVCIEHNGHYTHTENQATGRTQSCNVKDIILEPPIEFWNINTEFGRTTRYINHPSNLPAIQITDTPNKCFCCTSYPCINLVSHLHYSLVLTFTPCYEHIPDGTRRIGDFSTSFTSIPHQALLDRHCTHITWKSGMPLEALQEATH